MTIVAAPHRVEELVLFNPNYHS